MQDENTDSGNSNPFDNIDITGDKDKSMFYKSVNGYCLESLSIESLVTLKADLLMQLNRVNDALFISIYSINKFRGILHPGTLVRKLGQPGETSL